MQHELRLGDLSKQIDRQGFRILLNQVQKQQNYYAILKVAQDAPIEVIRAAYKTLSQKNHPDRNPDTPKANQVMVQLNIAYQHLSDPEKRRAHDNSLAQSQAGSQANTTSNAAATAASNAQSSNVSEPKTKSNTRTSPHAKTQPQNTNRSNAKSVEDEDDRVRRPLVRSKVRTIFIGGLVAFVAIMLYTASNKKVESGAKPIDAASTYLRPLHTPKGVDWPETSSYLRGYFLENEGAEAVIIDNRQNSADIFAKLVVINAQETKAVRTFLVAGKESFSIHYLPAGRYELRYIDLSNGRFQRLPPVELREAKTEENSARPTSSTEPPIATIVVPEARRAGNQSATFNHEDFFESNKTKL